MRRCHYRHPNRTSAKDFAAEAATKLKVKLVGYVQAVNAALPLLKPSSSIVLFSGLAKANPYPGSTMISVVNGGVVGVVKTLAVELGPIRVNSILAEGRVGCPRCRRRDARAHAVFFLLDKKAVHGSILKSTAASN